MLAASSLHIPQAIKKSKRSIALTKTNPLVLVLSQDFSYLNYFTQTILKLHEYPYVIKRAKGKYLMNYTLPLICYEDNILSKDNLVQFLCDIRLGTLNIVQYFERKQNIKRIFKGWHSIFYNECKSEQKGDILKLTRFDANNQIYQQLMKFSKDIVNKGYKRTFQTYSEDTINIQDILMVDIVNTILRDCPKENCDLILRGYFSEQIDYAQKYKVKVEDWPQPMRQEEESLNFILLDGQSKPQPDFPLKNFNLKWFSGVFVGLVLIFGKWAH